MSRFPLKLLAPCALIATLTHPVSVLAASTANSDEPAARVVRYNDLDLNRNAGVATLYARISWAARAVCEPSDVVTVKILRERGGCRQDAVERAIAQVNSPALTRYYLGKAKAVADNRQ
jgi:UrcA family protein